VILPLVGRRIPIVADDYADPEQGSGAVKITPAHDFNDFEVGRRHSLPMINVFDETAAIAIDGNEDFLAGLPEGDVPAIALCHGKDRFDARELIVGAMDAQGLLAEVEKTQHTVPYGDRSDVVIEPWLTDQWYVDAKTLAAPAIDAVERGETVFVPRSWEKTYFEWMRNIQPWCVSRQLWWGHRIPAWYGPDGSVFVAEDEADALAQAQAKYGKPAFAAPDLHEGVERPAGQDPATLDEIPLLRDQDVLDTWFSSALWPFSTLGWPDDTNEVQRYYKTDVLVTGFDIIFFWVARMMMMGLHFKNEVPFHTVYIHALVRDEKGQKMSKSKGNVIDPIALVDTYGADALRFTLAAMAAQGRDIKLSASRVEGYRNFGTKLWNAARFCQMNECIRVEGFDPGSVKAPVNRWILGRMERAAAAVTEGLEAYKFNEAAGALYTFIWRVFCDWYLEFIKPELNGPDGPGKVEARATAAHVLDQAVALLHPFMPFLTEELWDRLAEHGPARESMLIEAAWPSGGAALFDAAADAEMEWVVEAVSEIRSVRAEMNVPAGARIQLIVKDADQETRNRLRTHEDVIKTLARISSIRPVGSEAELPKGSIQVILGEATFALPLADVIDIAQEIARLQKEIAKAEGEVAKIDKKLANEKFLAKAPAEVVEEQRERREEAEGTKARLAAALERLRSAG
jgi:valyl-tRNA synthetase